MEGTAKEKKRYESPIVSNGCLLVFVLTFVPMAIVCHDGAANHGRRRESHKLFLHAQRVRRRGPHRHRAMKLLFGQFMVVMMTSGSVLSASGRRLAVKAQCFEHLPSII